jgi:hypothetical protein
MTEEIPSGDETATEEASELPGRCTGQNVLIVVLRQRYLSSLIQRDLFTAENAFRTTGNQEKTADTKPECRFGSMRSVSLRSRGLINYFFNIPYTLNIFFLTRYILQIFKEHFAMPYCSK